MNGRLMLATNYRPFVERMINRYEGGYGWNRSDPGGPTKFGVTCYDLAKFMHQQMDSMTRWAPIVKAMPLSTADEIINVDYAEPCRFSELNPGKDCTVIDFGYNSGPSRSIKYAQAVVGVRVDGALGEITLKAINDYEPRAFINEFCDIRLDFLHRLGTWQVFGSGWAARVADLRNYSLNLAFPPAKAPADGYVDKLDRIPLAYGKAYDPEDLPCRVL